MSWVLPHPVSTGVLRLSFNGLRDVARRQLRVLDDAEQLARPLGGSGQPIRASDQDRSVGGRAVSYNVSQGGS